MKKLSNNKNENSWSKPLVITAISVFVTLIGVVWSIILGYLQLSQTNKIAYSEKQIKILETFSKDFLNIDYTKEVWESEGSLRLLGVVLNKESKEDEDIKAFARIIFEECITTSIAQFHRTENIRLNAARVIASMYHIDKRFVINKLIEEIKDTTYPGYNYINGGVVVTLARIPNYWEGTKEQYQKVEQLRNHRFLGDENKTDDYKNGWLNNEALKKWKEVY